MYVGCSWRESQGPVLAFAASPRSYPSGDGRLGLGNSLMGAIDGSGRLLGSAGAGLETHATRSAELFDCGLGSDEGGGWG